MTPRDAGFLPGPSEFYPDFDRLLRQQVIETYSEVRLTA